MRCQGGGSDIHSSFLSRNWFGRLAVGALCLLFFWLFLIPIFILFGYFVETARTISRGGRELPPWTDVGKKLREGFVLAVVLFIWDLPGTILSWGSYPFLFSRDFLTNRSLNHDVT